MAEEDKPHRTTEDAPRSLRVVAYLFMLTAGGGLGRMAAALILRGEFLLDIGVLLFAVAAVAMVKGIGWRIFAIVMLVLTAAGLLFGTGVTGYRLATGAPGSDWWVFDWGTVRIVHILLMAFLLACFALSTWQLHVLFSLPVKEWFRRPRYPHVIMTQGTKHMLILFFILGSLPPFLWGSPRLFDKPYDSGLFAASHERSLHVSYGYRFGRLAYAVFVEWPHGESMHAAVSSSRGEEARLKTPDGKVIKLPNETQLYEIVDGKFRTSPRRVTKEQLEEFLRSNPDRHTIDTLLSFVDAHGDKPPSPPDAQK